MIRALGTFAGCCSLLLFALQGLSFGGELFIFAGAASKPATEETAKAFEKKTGVKVNLTFGGSGFVLSQMALAKKGDLYFPGSSDYMEIAKQKGLVFPESEKYVVYLVPAINVQKGNPKGIKLLRDLIKPGLRVAIANPENVCVGLYAAEIIEKNYTADEKARFRNNLVNYTESCEKTATAISLKAVDAVIGWEVFQHWDPERIETIPLRKNEIVRIGYIPIAISRFTTNRNLAQEFIDFILSDEGKIFFKKYHYFMSPEEAMAWIGEKKPIGGAYKIPAEWTGK
ncbi:MAG TPA: molybdate ABC transporter substrate-binding protein [Smithellaceae bacterium]|nr:molybdate ABC transporter substrate-binding protein [Smithellaceae bacterium]HRS88511.1 molybdate ABC transporter substrate-binding protein [Smithellaceae bacterium]HRV25265.1 molybdate ABC transporter substrate-binding protein [Smithellaceae bacterium]